MNNAKIIKVFGFLGDHPIYESIVRYPPEKVLYIPKASLKRYETLRIYSNFSFKIKKIINSIFNNFGVPRMVYILNTFECNLIHSSRGFLVLNKKPWVVDLEHVGSFGAFHKEKVKRIAIKFLKSNWCKKILPHSIAAKNSLINAWKINDRKILDKIEIMYPAINKRNIKKVKKDEISIGFLATRGAFYEKGGRELLEAFKILSKRYDNIRLIMKVKPPEEIIKRYSLPKVEFLTKHFNTREELFREFYEKIDIFVLPTYVDSFGYSLLEAMSVGLPLISTDIFAIPEIIEEGKNGLLVHSPISDFRTDYVPFFFDRSILRSKKIKIVVNQLVEKISILVESDKLRRKMGNFGIKMIESGKFSVKERNIKLRRVYEECLNY